MFSRELFYKQYSGFYLWFLPIFVLIIRIITSIVGNAISSIFTPLVFVITAASLIPIIKAKTPNYKSVVFLALAIFVFGCAEVGWSIIERIFHIDPTLNIFLSYIYVIPNLLFVIAFIVYAKTNLHFWHPIQFGVDLIAVSLITIKFIYILFFENSILGIINLDFLSFSNYLYLALDTIVIILLVTLYISSKSTKNNQGNKIIALSMVIYSTADLLYVWQVLNNQFVPNGYIDWLYMGALLLLATGIKVSFLHYKPEQQLITEHRLFNEGSIWAAKWILIIPALTIILNGVNWRDEFEYSLVIITYLLISLYVQNSIAKERLLFNQIVHNRDLQSRVEERTQELHTINKNLTQIVQHDTLTGLYNRSHFIYLIDQLIEKDPNHHINLILFDIDRFKMINDLYGQDIGDIVLKHIAEKIDGYCDEDSYTARLGGDEFAILCYGLVDLKLIKEKIVDLISVFAKPIDIPPFQILVHMHIGVASYPKDAHSRASLLKCAKTAVEQSKKMKLKNCSFYDKEVHEQVRRRHELELVLSKADMNKEFTLFYQPQYDISGQILFGMEALIRWHSPTLGNVSPLEFISIAEETGLILDIGYWVMETAMHQIIKWNLHYSTELRMGINISPIQLEDPNFVNNVMKLLSQTGAKPTWLTFEITESSAMLADVFGKVLTTLTKMGIAISIDDFGTGYSSFSYLKRYSIDYLKIDKQLVDKIATVPDEAQIVQAIISMAKALKIKTVAEGVEAIEQINMLNQMGCDKIQGYYFGKPISYDHFESLHFRNKSIFELQQN